MTAFVFFIFKSAGEGEGWFDGDSTRLIHYKKKHKKHNMNKSKINKYKIKNNNKTNTKHEFNVKYEKYKQDIRSVCLYILRFGIYIFTWNLQKFAVILLYQQIKPSLLLE
jgi:hypothetical protein